MSNVARKFLGHRAYGSVPNLHSSYIVRGDKVANEGHNRIATQKIRDRHDTVIVEEKLDGSNMGIYRKDGQIYAISRAGYLATTSPFPFQHRFDEWVHLRDDMWLDILRDGERLMGEWMVMSHGVKYAMPH